MTRATLVVGFIALWTGAAVAQGDPVPADPLPADPDGGGEVADDDAAANAPAEEPVALPAAAALPPPEPEAKRGRAFLLGVDVAVELGLDAGAAGEALSVAPDLRIVTHGLPAIAIIHSTQAFTGFHGIGRGASLCVAGDACDAQSPALYHSVGLEVGHVIRSPLRGGSLLEGVNRTSLAVFGGPMVTAFDPFALALKVGFRAGYISNGGLIVETTPNIHVGLTERDLIGDRLYVPITAGVVPNELFSLQGEVGIAAPLDGFVDGLQVPLGVNVLFNLSPRLMLEASFTFSAIHGGDAVAATGFDARAATLTLSYETIAGGG